VAVGRLSVLSTSIVDSDASVEPMLIRRQEVLDTLDRVLLRRLELGEACLFAMDVVESVADGTGTLEDPEMLEPLRQLAHTSIINLEIVEEFRSRLARGTESGTA
jgi:hypothetical protein